MTRVDFYVLDEADDLAWMRLACRLAERAWTETGAVFVLAGSSEDARSFDELLWTFRDRSFVPHGPAESGDRDVFPVRIGTEASAAAPGDVLINLGPSVPPGFERFERILEPLDADPQRRRQGRERFRYYREHGVTLESHPVGANHEP